MKATYRIGLKLPIEGIQFSNIEQSIEWEIEGDNAEQLLGNLKTKLDKWINEQTESVGEILKNTIQDKNAKLEKARQVFIDMKRGE